MKKLSIILAMGFLLYAEPMKFQVDPAHTTITFKVRHMMITNVTGTFERFEGWVELDTTDLSLTRAEGVVYVESINTRNSERDNHLKSPDFFDAKNYPTMKMSLLKMYKKGKEWWADVDLTIKGTTRTLSFPVELFGPIRDPWGNLRIGIEANFTIDRFDYGLRWNKVLETGGLIVDRKVKIELHIEAVYTPEKTGE
jgi:polyisoprenoid-binding protein YceI